MSRALALLIALRSLASWRTFWRSGRRSIIVWLGKLYVLLLVFGAAAGWLLAVWYSVTSKHNDFLSARLLSYATEAARIAPLILLVVLIFTGMLSLFDKPFQFSPAEVDFLRAGPFHRRQLLNYKIGTAFTSQVLLSFFLAAPSGAAMSGIIPAFVGTLLLLTLLLLVSLVASLSGTMLGFQDSRGLFRLAIVLAILSAPLAFVWIRFGKSVDDLVAINRQVERFPLWVIAMSPLRWFVEVTLAKRLWPDLVQFSALCLLVNGLLFVTVHILDARLQERAEQDAGHVAGDDLAQTARLPSQRAPWALPMLASWRGLGPLAWRQSIHVIRKPAQSAFAILMYGVLIFLLFALTRGGRELLFLPTLDSRTEINTAGAWICGIAAVMLSMLIASGLAFDFRADMGQIDVLKGLPIEPIVMTAGQLMVPVAIAVVMQWLALVVIAIGLKSAPVALWIAAAFVPPVSVSVMAIENLPTFWFPMRQLPGSKPEPFELLGHVLVYPLVRMLIYTAAIVATFVMSAGAYLLFGHSPVAALAIAWFTLVAIGTGLVMLLAQTFDDFDVTRAVPA